METKNILTTQKDFVKAMAEDFEVEDVKVSVVYVGGMSCSDYCHFLGIDYATAQLLGEVSYRMTYCETEYKIYQLVCETFIDNNVNDKLSFVLEDSEDYLGFFTLKEEQKIGVAQWLPSNWKELITDEQLHDILQERNIQTIECLNDDDVPDEMKTRIAIDWCENNSSELKDYLSDDDKEDIAYGWIEENASTAFEKALDNMSGYDTREAIKDAIDNL